MFIFFFNLLLTLFLQLFITVELIKFQLELTKNYGSQTEIGCLEINVFSETLKY